MTKRLNITVFGRVQGIGYRYSALQAARKYGINGFVENLPDGSVYLEAEGEETAMEDFLGWCRRGPIGARVERIETDPAEPAGLAGFHIR